MVEVVFQIGQIGVAVAGADPGQAVDSGCGIASGVATRRGVRRLNYRTGLVVRQRGETTRGDEDQESNYLESAQGEDGKRKEMVVHG